MSRYLSRVSERHRTPAVAIWVCVATAFVLALWSRAYSVIVSISTIGFYVSYGLPILLALYARRAGRLTRGPWHVGRWSNAANLVAIVWIAFTSVLFVLPPNQLTGYTFAGALALLCIYYFAWARTHFAGPPALKSLREAAIPTRTEAS
jgi:amino acid transporter